MELYIPMVVWRMSVPPQNNRRQQQTDMAQTGVFVSSLGYEVRAPARSRK